MDKVDKIIAQMRDHPNNVRFGDLRLVCERYFGQPRINGSHHYYKMPWRGDPRVCIQEKNGKGKAYQVRQVLEAIDRTNKEGDRDA
jgi:hypothetical protein